MLLKNWIGQYQPQNEEEFYAALREIMQDITLAALSRTAFFEKAAFYGGTALRIFYGLDRFSEDLDFSLLAADPHFSFEPYFDGIILEFQALGINVHIQEKSKVFESKIDSAFLKTPTVWKELVLIDVIEQTGINLNRAIKIKIEVDTKPPLNFETEQRLLLKPFSFYVKCFSPSSLFAGKLHALLFRKWKNRVKGRDWFDFEWYVRQGIPINRIHFLERIKASSDWDSETINSDQIRALVSQRIQEISFSQAKEDVKRFIKDDQVLDIWSEAYFLQLVKEMKFI